MLKKSDINLKEWEFEFQQRNNHPILMADQWCRSLSNKFKDEFKLPIPRIDYLITGSFGRGYIKKRQKKKIIKELRENIPKESYLNYVFSATQNRLKDLEGIIKIINRNINKKRELSNKELANLWEEFDKVFLKVIPWFFIPWYVIEYNLITDRIKSGLIKHRDEIEEITDINNALMVLSYPVRKVLIQKEQDNFYKLADFIKNKKDFRKNRKFLILSAKYLKKYSWTKTFLFSSINLLTLPELSKRLEEFIKKDGIKEYKLQKIQQLRNKKLADKLLKLLSNDKSLIKQIKRARDFGWLLSWSVEEALFLFRGMRGFLDLIVKELDMKYHQFILLTYQEILDSLKSGKKIELKEFKKRSQGYVFLIEKREPSIIFGRNGRSLSNTIDKNIGTLNKGGNIITGQAVSPGIVKGKAKIIMKVDKLREVKIGDVLVCSMTSPEYVPAMRNAIAIITDEGGLLSHASIVSRELGKPCVVGTKVATKALKDGDLVEVDANKGTVRILKKNNE